MWWGFAKSKNSNMSVTGGGILPPYDLSKFGFDSLDLGCVVIHSHFLSPSYPESFNCPPK